MNIFNKIRLKNLIIVYTVSLIFLRTPWKTPTCNYNNEMAQKLHFGRKEPGPL